MNKKIIKVLLLFLIINVVPFYITVKANEDSIARVLIIYDNEISDNSNINIVNSVKELLGAYNARGYSLSSKNYEKGKIQRYNKVIIINTINKLDNSSLISDLKTYKGELFWIGNGINTLLDDNEIYRIEHRNRNVNAQKILYSINGFSKNNISNKIKINKNYNFTVLNERYVDKVYAYIDDGKEKQGIVYNKSNLWYMALLPEDTNLLFILSDVLNDFFNITSFEEPRVFIRIDDINMSSNVENLKALSDYLNNENIPFIISLNPFSIDKNIKEKNTLWSKTELVEAVKYSQLKGGTVVLQDYVYNNIKDYSQKNFNKENYDKGIDNSIEQCVKCGIYPLGFEALNDNIEEWEYNEVKKHFSTYIGRYKSDMRKTNVIEYPYMLKNTEYFNIFIPENLGEIDPKDRFWIKKIMEKYDMLSMVRGNSGGICFNSSLDLDYLKELVQFLKKKNVKFLDLKNYDNWVKCKHIDISSYKGKIKVNIDNPKKVVEKINIKNNNIMKINIMVISIFLILIIIFLCVFLYYRAFNNKEYK